jgi:hypothetical protein
MAHFAEIKNNTVARVIVINNEVIIDENNIEQEALGVAFCKTLYGDDTQWVQTSYNGTFRGQYAGTGMTYDPVADEFVLPTIKE